MDGLYSYIKDKGCSDAIFLSIKSVLEFEEYDTESIELDVLLIDVAENTNIGNLLNKKVECFRLIKQYTRNVKRMFFIYVG